MNKTQAISRLSKMLGKQFAYRVDPKAPDEEMRQQIREAYKVAKAQADLAVATRKARYEELLKGDVLYQELKARASEAEKMAERAGAGLHRYRVTVGLDHGWAFSVKAEGDNWEEVVEKFCSKEPQ